MASTALAWAPSSVQEGSDVVSAVEDRLGVEVEGEAIKDT